MAVSRRREDGSSLLDTLIIPKTPQDVSMYLKVLVLSVKIPFNQIMMMKISSC